MARPRLTHPLIWLAAALLVLFWWDQTWLMPGPLSTPHAKYEGRCTHCHPGFGGTPRQGCLACKEKMKLVTDRGIHLNAPVKRCAHCHRDHRTRPYPLASAWVDPDVFDHDWTGFQRGPYHGKLECKSCHFPGRPRLVLRSVQGRALSDWPAGDCAGCHEDFSPGLWQHKRSKCPLDALHAGLACASCHDQGWGPDKKPGCKQCHPKADYGPKDLCGPDSTLAILFRARATAPGDGSKTGTAHGPGR